MARVGSTGEQAARCARHGTAVAGWQCTGCHSALCPECTAIRSSHGARLFICCICGNVARPITTERTDEPMTARILDAMVLPLTPSGGWALLGMASFLAAASYLSDVLMSPGARWLTSLVYVGTSWAYLMYIIRITGIGATRIGAPRLRDLGEDVAGPAQKGVLATAIVWGPALLYALAVRRWEVERLLSLQSLRDPVSWALLGLAFLYAPMALLAAATDIEVGGMLNPLRIVRYIGRIGRDYVVCVAALIVLAAVSGVLETFVVPRMLELPIPVIGPVAAKSVELYVPFVMARTLGLILFVHGWALDWGARDAYRDPVLRTEPRGMSTAAVAPPNRGSSQLPALAVSDSHTAATAPGERTAVTNVAERIAAALAEYDTATAMDLYASSREIPGLAPEDHFRVGQAALGENVQALAIRALNAAALSTHAIAPDALLTLGRLYEEQLGDPESATRLYREIATRFAASSAAPEATRRLSALTS